MNFGRSHCENTAMAFLCSWDTKEQERRNHIDVTWKVQCGSCGLHVLGVPISSAKDPTTASNAKANRRALHRQGCRVIEN